jgi:hypothetical protein
MDNSLGSPSLLTGTASGQLSAFGKPGVLKKNPGFNWAVSQKSDERRVLTLRAVASKTRVVSQNKRERKRR